MTKYLQGKETASRWPGHTLGVVWLRAPQNWARSLSSHTVLSDEKWHLLCAPTHSVAPFVIRPHITHCLFLCPGKAKYCLPQKKLQYKSGLNPSTLYHFFFCQVDHKLRGLSAKASPNTKLNKKYFPGAVAAVGPWSRVTYHWYCLEPRVHVMIRRSLLLSSSLQTMPTIIAWHPGTAPIAHCPLGRPLLGRLPHDFCSQCLGHQTAWSTDTSSMACNKLPGTYHNRDKDFTF